MTDERYIIGKGRLVFDYPISPTGRRLSPHLGYRWEGQVPKGTILALRVAFIVGYNPQKLLPSPSRLAREWMHRMMGLMTREMLEYGQATMLFESIPTMFPGEEITLSRALAGPRWAGLYEDFPDVSRWNDADSDPLADLQAWQKREPTYRHEVAIIRSNDLTHAELRALELDPTVKGIVIDIEQDRSMRMEAAGLAALYGHLDKPVAPKPTKDYLQHDPTKNTRKRRRRR